MEVVTYDIKDKNGNKSCSFSKYMREFGDVEGYCTAYGPCHVYSYDRFGFLKKKLYIHPNSFFTSSFYKTFDLSRNKAQYILPSYSSKLTTYKDSHDFLINSVSSYDNLVVKDFQASFFDCFIDRCLANGFTYPPLDNAIKTGNKSVLKQHLVDLCGDENFLPHLFDSFFEEGKKKKEKTENEKKENKRKVNRKIDDHKFYNEEERKKQENAFLIEKEDIKKKNQNEEELSDFDIFNKKEKKNEKGKDQIKLLDVKDFCCDTSDLASTYFNLSNVENNLFSLTDEDFIRCKKYYISIFNDPESFFNNCILSHEKEQKKEGVLYDDGFNNVPRFDNNYNIDYHENVNFKSLVNLPINVVFDYISRLFVLLNRSNCDLKTNFEKILHSYPSSGLPISDLLHDPYEVSIISMLKSRGHDAYDLSDIDKNNKNIFSHLTNMVDLYINDKMAFNKQLVIGLNIRNISSTYAMYYSNLLLKERRFITLVRNLKKHEYNNNKF